MARAKQARTRRPKSARIPSNGRTFRVAGAQKRPGRPRKALRPLTSAFGAAPARVEESGGDVVAVEAPSGAERE